MKFGKIVLLSCVTMGMATGCVSIGNSGMEALTEEEKAELRQEMDEMRQEVQAGLNEAEAEIRTVLEDAVAEAREELGGEPEWIREMICGEQERPKKVIWKNSDGEAEIADRAEFAESLALEDWKASDESVEGLTESATVTVRWKKSIGLLDGWKEEYVDIGSLTAYEDADLVTARIHALDGVAGEEFGEWLTVVYEAPEKALESLRGPVEK